MLLNHNVYIPPIAVAIHGYTREYLRKHGGPPREVHAAFREYALDYPLVAHNLGYDWNRCLVPEWARLRIPTIGQRGFCTMRLGRRLLPQARSHRLAYLKERFRINTSTRSHRAKHDVRTVVELFERIYRPKLQRAGLTTFESVAQFAKRTPIAECIALIRSAPRRIPATTTAQRLQL
jgi:DNA polymerase-3 subunit epsilon